MSVRSGEAATIALTLDVEPDQALWKLEDETGAVLVTETAVPGTALDGLIVTLTTTAAQNTLPAGRHRGLRVLRLRYRAEDSFTGWREIERAYDVIASTGELAVQTNSFVTYNEALLLAREMADAEGFSAASRETRIVALAEAWRVLVRLRYDLPEDYDRRMNRVTDFPGADPGDLADMTAAEFLALDPRFVAAIKRAQVVEAIERLAGRSVAQARNDGLMSSTIGEVSQMYRPGRPYDIGVSRRALMELRGYIVYAPRLRRV